VTTGITTITLASSPGAALATGSWTTRTPREADSFPADDRDRTSETKSLARLEALERQVEKK